jgi:hypothetical protein
MREFFRGWRRQVGAVTLFIACVLTMGWVRSGSTEDRTTMILSQRFYLFVSSRSSISWWAMDNKGSPSSVVQMIGRSSATNSPRPALSHSDIIEVLTHLYAVGDGRDNPLNVACWTVAYWSVVLPLTILSAYLLLSKPRVPAPKKISDPTSAQRT